MAEGVTGVAEVQPAREIMTTIIEALCKILRPLRLDSFNISLMHRCYGGSLRER